MELQKYIYFVISSAACWWLAKISLLFIHRNSPMIYFMRFPSYDAFGRKWWIYSRGIVEIVVWTICRIYSRTTKILSWLQQRSRRTSRRDDVSKYLLIELLRTKRNQRNCIDLVLKARKIAISWDTAFTRKTMKIRDKWSAVRTISPKLQQISGICLTK